jgi:hypothetical protein
MTWQDNHLTSLTAEWAHQRLPLPLHWFLSPIATISNNKQGCLQSSSDTRNPTEHTHDTLEVAKGGLFFLLGLETMSSFLPTDAPSPVRFTPLIWKLHSLSVMLLSGMGVLEDDKSRDVYEALQNLYGQLLDESRSVRSAEHFLEDNVNVVPETGKKSALEFLRFQSEIHESYSTFLETLVEQFASISYGDIIFGRQVAVYLHRCTETPVRLAAWNGLANAHVLEILPPLEKCFAEAEGYLEPVEVQLLTFNFYIGHELILVEFSSICSLVRACMISILCCLDLGSIYDMGLCLTHVCMPESTIFKNFPSFPDNWTVRMSIAMSKCPVLDAGAKIK